MGNQHFVILVSFFQNNQTKIFYFNLINIIFNMCYYVTKESIMDARPTNKKKHKK